MDVNIQFLDLSERPAPGCSLAVILPRREREGGEAQLSVCRKLAGGAGCAVVTAPFDAPGFSGLACCTPQGDFFQPACFPAPGSRARPGDDVAVFSLSFGKMALCCDEDIFQPQYARLAALRGCVLLAASSACSMDEAHRMAGPWSAVQANCLPVSLACPGGGMLILPCAMTEDQSGFGRSGFDTGELKAAYDSFPVFDTLNAAFYRRYEKELSSW